ncbi:hypothetical protein [Streptomyces sp. 900105245]
MTMLALLIAIVVVGIALTIVSAARRELLAKAKPTAPVCCGCAPCRHACHPKGR